MPPSWISVADKKIIRNSELLYNAGSEGMNMQVIYNSLPNKYPKFFKMDSLCKWAFLAGELLLNNTDIPLYSNTDKTKAAILLATAHGCMDVDKRYAETIAGIPSPALFVYTLPNIMLGELSIRHGFKGEQACMMTEKFDATEICFWANDLLSDRDMDACLCGWADVVENKPDIFLLWLTRKTMNALSPKAIEELYNQNR